MQSYGEMASGPGKRAAFPAMKRGFLGRCPQCGEGRLFASFAKSVEACAVCGEDMHHHRADDMPAYLVIFVVGHLVVAAYMGVEFMVEWTPFQHMALWLPVTALLSIALLQPLKGAVIGLQWAWRMHGFGDGEPDHGHDS
ncbi:MAG: DUF983 domain-containing protein [Phyllobacteriaceae bacterium]|nr:DUF983 domain-containing protein [Phyllobacteriaceae bacterium]